MTTLMQKTALSEASSSTSKAVSMCVHLSYYIIHSFSVFILQQMGMAHLLGQLSLPQNSTQALPLLHCATTLASLTCPQPAYVYALLLLSKFTQLPPPSSFTPYIPSNSSPHLEAQKHLERAAFLPFMIDTLASP